MEFMVGSTPGWKSPGIRRWRHAALLVLTVGLLSDWVQSAVTATAPMQGLFAPWFWPMAAICTVLELALSLPLQNALAASLQTAGLVWVAAAGGEALGISLNVVPITRVQLPGGVTPTILASWVALSPCFRTLARALLNSRRDGDRFGLELLAGTSVLSGASAMMLQPASPHRDWRAIAGWIGIAVVLHAVNTPWLLNKRPARETPGIGSLVLPALIGFGMLRSLTGATPLEVRAAAGLAIVTVLGLAWRGLTRAR
jgi:hypothetical protein